MFETNEGGNQYEHSLDHAVEFFSKAGSLFTKKQSFYENEESALSLFQKVWIVDKETAFKLLLWLRDCRGGAGNRSAFRSIIYWLSDPKIDGGPWIAENIDWIPEVGRFDDFRTLFDTPLENLVSEYWAGEIRKNNVLAAKWANRKDKPLKHALGIKEEGKFRKLLAKIRKEHIVEHKMCNRRYSEIEYHTVPSVAMARYTKAFERNDPERFANYKEKLQSGETTVNASVLFPHDCVRTVRSGDRKIADSQFEALPNYLEDTDERMVVLSDTSGSMGTPVAGSIQAVDVSQGLALYCSAKIPEENPFHKKFIGFCDEGRFKDWNGMSFSEAVSSRQVFDRAVGPTRIDAALDSILKTAKFFNLTNQQIPTTLLIVSDMQFHQGTGAGPFGRSKNRSMTEVNKALSRWEKAGYKKPKIVYWNVAGYAGSPETVMSNNVALVSGFSPAILKAIFAGEDMTPIGIMKKALEKYEIRVPKNG